MKMKTDPNNKDLSKVLNSSHENKWVAISRDYGKVVAYGDNLVDLDREVRNPSEVIYTRVLAKNVSFAPAGF